MTAEGLTSSVGSRYDVADVQPEVQGLVRSGRDAASTSGHDGVLPRSVDRITLLAFLVATLILGANWVGVRFSNRELPPFWGAGLRFAAGRRGVAGRPAAEPGGPAGFPACARERVRPAI